MLLRPLFAAALLALPLTAMAETPNITPGLWEFTSTTSVTGEIPIPDEADTDQEWISQGDLEDPDLQFLEVEEGCEQLEYNVSADGFDYRMICREGGGGTNINGRQDFLGERVEGSVDVTVQSPMGEMQMDTVVEGAHSGDC